MWTTIYAIFKKKRNVVQTLDQHILQMAGAVKHTCIHNV